MLHGSDVRPVPGAGQVIRRWRLFWQPRDLWVGAYWSTDTRTLYVCPLPTVGLALTLGRPACGTCRRAQDDGVHEPANECTARSDGAGTWSCPDPKAHHAYRPLPLWRRTVTDNLYPTVWP